MASTYEIGTMFGGFTLGFISDRLYKKRSPVGAFAIVVSFLIAISLTIKFKDVSTFTLAVSLFFLGLLLGGLHHILCVTCAADLGQSQAFNNNRGATSTVTGIIDGLGSLGTAIGQAIIGFTISSFGWQYGYLLIISISILSTLIPLSKVLLREI